MLSPEFARRFALCLFVGGDNHISTVSVYTATLYHSVSLFSRVPKDAVGVGQIASKTAYPSCYSLIPMILKRTLISTAARTNVLRSTWHTDRN